MEHNSSSLDSGYWLGDMLMTAGVAFLTAGTCVVLAAGHGVLLAGIFGVLLPLRLAKLLDIAADIRCGLAFLWSRGATAAAVLLRTVPVARPVVDGLEAGVAVLDVCS